MPSEDQAGTSSAVELQQPSPAPFQSEAIDFQGAEQLEIPLDRTVLPTGMVRLEAQSARIIIRWDAEPDLPYVTARWSLPETSAVLLLASRSSTSNLRYVADPTIEGYPLIELHLTPGQEAAVSGSALSVDAAEAIRSLEPQLDPEGDPAPPPSSHLAIQVSDSDLTLAEIPLLTVTCVDSVVYASGGDGPWVFDLRGGSAELVDHHGSVQLTGRHTETRFNGIIGAQSLDITESSAFVTGGGGTLTATTSGGSIEVEEMAGDLTITGAMTSIALRRTRSKSLTLTGENLYVRAEDGLGRARVTLDGGDFQVTRWTPRIDLTARIGAVATVTDLEGDIAFSAADGSSVRISGVTGHVRGTANDSTIEGSSLKSIQLQATNSDIEVEQTRHLTTFDLVDSTARLHLYELLGKPEISLAGSSRADIELHYPCQVRVGGPGAKNAGRLSIEGCEHLQPNQGWRSPRQTRHGEKPVEPIHLTLTLDHRAEVSVRGY